jgi:Mg-chelatase subunit ChlD
MSAIDHRASSRAPDQGPSHAFGRRRTACALTLAASVLVTAACQSSPTAQSTAAQSTFPPAPPPSEAPVGDVGTLGPQEPYVATPQPFETCATEPAAVESKPMYLAFIFDKSGSMAVAGSPKWDSAKAASRAFFEAPDSAGVHASLTFFPSDFDIACGPDVYETPTVPMTALPSTDFGQSLDAQFPNGGTPTHEALEGAIVYAQKEAANEAKDGKVAIVLVTDGLPESGCAEDTVDCVSAIAASVAETLPTYVIGVGGELTSLTQIAAAGGTKSAFIVDTNAPEQIQRDFLGAINAIKMSNISCDYAIPSAPSGKEIDPDKVNVVHHLDSGDTTLAYNPQCDAGAGWHYDDPNAPKHIQLCDVSCRDANNTPGELRVQFGCAARVDPIK